MDTDQESLALIALRFEREFAIGDEFTVENIEEYGCGRRQAYKIIDDILKRGLASIHVVDKGMMRALTTYIRTESGMCWVPMSRGIQALVEKKREQRSVPQLRYRVPPDFNAVIHSRLKAAKTWLSVDQILHNDLTGNDDKKSIEVIRKKAIAYLEYLFEVGEAEFNDDQWRFAR